MIPKKTLNKLLSQGKNYPQISKEIGFSKPTICFYVRRYGLHKKFNIKRGAKKGYIPVNLKSLHRKGRKNGQWKGDKVGYQALHTWVRDRKGKAKKCSKCGSTKTVDWANKSRQYKRNITDWIQLCRSCHIYYDRGRKK